MVILQGRRRLFKSGPAEVAIECGRHERGESTKRGLLPLSLGGMGGFSSEKILELCVLMGVLCVWTKF